MEQQRTEMEAEISTTKACNCNCNFNIQQQILRILITATAPLAASELSKFLGIQKSTINTALYNLERRGQTQKQKGSASSKTTKPKWVYHRGDQEVRAREVQLMELLTRKGCPAMSIHSLAWELKESKVAVNRILYDLEKDGRVERVQLSPPIWKARVRDMNQSISTTTDEGQLQLGLVNTQSSQTKKNCCEDTIGRNRKRGSDDVSVENDQNEDTTCQRVSKKRKLCSSGSIVSPALMQDGKEVHHIQNKDVDDGLSKDIAEAVWSAYEKHHEPACPAQKGVILAGFVLKKETELCGLGKRSEFKVIALGTGTKSIAGDKYSLEGTVVHDCHAEIAARRSLLRWVYKQISTAGESDSYAIESENKRTPYELRPFELWLYCSQTPCGDAAVFSRTDPEPKCVPCFTAPKHGMFRLKPEAGHAGNLVNANEPAPSFDGLQLGDRSKCHTCSDKLAKWSVVGVQGALLAQLIPPLYTTGIVIGDVYSHGHAARAICCRSERALTKFSTPCLSLDSPYALHHPKIGHWQRNNKTKRTDQVKMKRNVHSINWALGDQTIEILDATTGRQKQDHNVCSRISKKSLFRSFHRLCETSSPEATYKEHKSRAAEYQCAKDVWMKAMSDMYGESWVGKPSEVDDFKIDTKDTERRPVELQLDYSLFD